MIRQKLIKVIRKIPLDTGVYIFKDQKGQFLYIGKASCLKRRIQSYFRDSSLDSRLEAMIKQIDKIDYFLCRNEIEALILESKLIKKYKPKYNIEWKDDKNFLYIMITNEEFPRLAEARPPLKEDAYYFGPFVDAEALRKSLRILRKIFPYRTCKKLPQKACLQYFIKNCSAPCIGKISSSEYKKNIKEIVKILSGRLPELIKILEKEMQKEAKKKNFEKAAQLRDRINNLKSLNQAIIFRSDSVKVENINNNLQELKSLFELKKAPRRIEAYDISNIAGESAAGSMVVFTNGLPDKKEYRRFMIKDVKGINDYKMIEEVLERRFKNFKINNSKFKNLPDLILVDGGKGQLSIALNVLKKFNLDRDIFALGIAKKREEIIIVNRSTRNKNLKYKIIKLPKNSKILHLIQRIRDEAHRFAINYHLKLREKKIKLKS